MNELHALITAHHQVTNIKQPYLLTCKTIHNREIGGKKVSSSTSNCSLICPSEETLKGFKKLEPLTVWVDYLPAHPKVFIPLILQQSACFSLINVLQCRMVFTVCSEKLWNIHKASRFLFLSLTAINSHLFTGILKWIKHTKKQKNKKKAACHVNKKAGRPLSWTLTDCYKALTLETPSLNTTSTILYRKLHISEWISYIILFVN